MASSDEQQRSDEQPIADTVIHRTKTIQFFNRSTPIILQNDNGPCPLLAICNVLLLRNQLNLNPDISEVSQEKLLSLVADRLIESNSNNNNKDAGYVENQQQNIADAIDLLPRLTTGIDVNIKFRRIDDFEFTSECAIFDLLDIPLCHGWLLDPQDHETAEAIGSKSYNTLMSDLVSLETWKMENEGKDKSVEDSVDFSAATTAALGVPSPILSKAKSFEESPSFLSDQQTLKKGDAEEEAELLRALKLSENDPSSAGDVGVSDENVHMLKSIVDSVNISEGLNVHGSSIVETTISGSDNVHSDGNVSLSERQDASHSLTADREKDNEQLNNVQLKEVFLSNDLAECNSDTSVLNEVTPPTLAEDAVHVQVDNSTLVIDPIEGLHKQNVEDNSGLIAGGPDSESARDGISSAEAAEPFASNIGGGEPIYEGEECIQDLGETVRVDQEPVYEGEAVLAEQADKLAKDASDASPKEKITLRQGELINNFLKSNASQLTFYGLFSLQEGLKERELCVFFRNNHFSTMFKLEGELYLLATDQGYITQPDLVWEKLNEVNGDTLFMTSNFKEFKLESSSNGTWDQQNAVASTADYLAGIDSSAPDGSDMNSDLQLAIALQQQEFEQQQPQQQQRNPSNQASGIGNSRLIVGPQVPKSSAKGTSSTPRQDQKAKDKSNCKIM